jgi:hypothetical protein
MNKIKSVIIFSLILIQFSDSFAAKLLGKIKSGKINKKAMLARQDSIITQMKNTFDVLQIEIDKKNDKGDIDPAAYKETTKFIDEKKSELTTLNEDIAKIQSMPKKQLKKYLTAAVFEQLLIKQNEIITENLTDITLIDEIRKEKQIDEFETSAFFPPGNFKVPEKMYDETLKSFEPIVNKILQYAEKYPGKEIKATIIVKGFSDEQSISKSSDLYKKLLNDFKTDNLELPKEDLKLQEKLNNYLSQLRANEVGNIVYDIAQKKKSLNPSLSNIKIYVFKEGHGYELPNKNLTYEKIDPKRRIVSFYWNIIPVNE